MTRRAVSVLGSDSQNLLTRTKKALALS